MDEENTMTAFGNAKKFFEACERPEGWAGCKQYAEDDAQFEAQSEALVDITTLEAYCDWMFGLCTVTCPNASYDLHSSSYDEKARTAVFVATYHIKHTGDGGPVPPTQKEVHTDFVYAITMSTDDKVEKLVKIWNSPWAFRELGWS